MLIDFVNKNIEALTLLENKFPNDQEFGKNVRYDFGSETYELDLPNDQEFGRALRKTLKNIQK